jgi:CheY-like chemotaxis protein
MSSPTSLPLMIVDDDDDMRDTIADIISAQGYTVAAFADARAALAALEGGQRPFLILLDLMMPGMSGWEFRAAQLKNPRLTPIPVVVVTAATTFIDGAPALPDIEILRKPFELDTLLTLVDRYAAAAPPRL